MPQSKTTPCIRYEDELDVKEMEMVKLEVTHRGVTRSKKVPVFKSATKVEGLFHVMDAFDKTANRLNFTVAEKWDLFEDVLDVVADRKWTNLTRNIANDQRTNQRFQEERAKLVAAFAEGESPRDTLLTYLREEVTKPRKTEPGIHASRVETLCLYANRLEGNEPELGETQIRKIIYDTFPKRWKNSYKMSQRDFRTDTIQGIVEYMNLCKEMSDEAEEKGQKRKNTQGNKGGSSKKSRSGGRVQESDDCPVHGGHKWKDCSLNPKSENYGMYQRRNGGTQGRGSGRGYGAGRGNGGRGYGRGDQGNRYGGRGQGEGRGNGYQGSSGSYYYQQASESGSQSTGTPSVASDSSRQTGGDSWFVHTNDTGTMMSPMTQRP